MMMYLLLFPIFLMLLLQSIFSYTYKFICNTTHSNRLPLHIPFSSYIISYLEHQLIIVLVPHNYQIPNAW